MKWTHMQLGCFKFWTALQRVVAEYMGDFWGLPFFSAVSVYRGAETIFTQCLVEIKKNCVDSLFIKSPNNMQMASADQK